MGEKEEEMNDKEIVELVVHRVISCLNTHVEVYHDDNLLVNQFECPSCKAERIGIYVKGSFYAGTRITDTSEIRCMGCLTLYHKGPDWIEK